MSLVLEPCVHGPRRLRVRLALWAAAAALLCAAPAGAAKVVQVRVGEHPEFTRVVFELDERAGYKMERRAGKSGTELVVTLDASSGSRKLTRRGSDVPLVEVRSAERAIAHIRLRKADLSIKEMILSKPYRVVLDVMRDKPLVAKTKAKPKPKAEAKPEPKAEAKAEPTPQPTAEAKSKPAEPVKPVAKVEPKVEPKPVAKAETKPAPKPEVKPEPKPAEPPKPVAKVEPKVEPKPEAKVEPPKPEPKLAKTEPAPAPKPPEAKPPTPATPPQTAKAEPPKVEPPKAEPPKAEPPKAATPAPVVPATDPKQAKSGFAPPPLPATPTTPQNVVKLEPPKPATPEKPATPDKPATPEKPADAKATPAPTQPPTQPSTAEVAPKPLGSADDVAKLLARNGAAPAPVEPAADAKPVDPDAAKTETPPGATVEPAPAAQPTPPPQTAKPKPEAPAKPAEKPKASAKAKPASDSEKGLFSNPLVLAGAGGVLASVVGLVFFMRRRRALPNDLDVTAIAEEHDGAAAATTPAASSQSSLDDESSFAGLFDDDEASSSKATPPAPKQALRPPPPRPAASAPPASEPVPTGTPLDSLFDDDDAQGDAEREGATDMPQTDLPMNRGARPGAPARPAAPAAAGAGADVMRLVQELERRIGALETKLDQANEAREKLERQVAAQSEELRVQRAAIARTQRALRTMSRGDEEKATEPALREETQTKIRG